MQQSVFTQISKLVGFVAKTVDYPTKEKAIELRSEVNQGDPTLSRYAFIEVMKIYRFAPAPDTPEQSDILNIICDVYKEGEVIYRNINA